MNYLFQKKSSIDDGDDDDDDDDDDDIEPVKRKVKRKPKIHTE